MEWWGNSGMFAAAGGDPYFANVSLLLHGEGANGSTSIIDSSPSPKVITPFGNAKISTLQSRFGLASVELDGSGDYLSLDPNAAELNLGYGDCTIEMFIYMRAFAVASGESYFSLVHSGGILNTVSTNSVQAYNFRYSPQQGNRLIFFHRNNNAGFTEGTHIFTKRSTVLNLALNTWHYIAAVRQGNSLKLYHNGNDVTDNSFGLYSWSTFNFSLPSATKVFEIGRQRGGNNDTFWDSNGFFDEVRITKGVARSIALPTAAFPDF